MTVEQLAKVDAREVMSEDEALHTLMHCENEQACQFCNPHNGYMDAEQAAYYSTPSPRKEHADGPDSCEDYWNACDCTACTAREAWVVNGRK